MDKGVRQRHLYKRREEMKERICIITGASSGIGKATALALAQEGVSLGLICRDAERGARTVEETVQKSGNPKIDLFLADLSSQASIRKVATEVLDTYPRIHILIHNAGIAAKVRQLSIDGIEMTFAVNHLAPFLLTHLLLDRLQASASSRLIVVSSEAHRNAKFEFDNLQGEKHFSGFGAYCITKLCNILFSYQLAGKLGTNVTVNAMHPGYLRTGIFRETPGLFRLLVILTAGNPMKGARALLQLATAPELEGVSGKYFKGSTETSSSPLSYDHSVSQRLWDLSSKLTRLS